MTKPPKPVPKFTSEAQERAYWEKHDSTKHLDWSKAQKATFPNLSRPPRHAASDDRFFGRRNIPVKERELVGHLLAVA